MQARKRMDGLRDRQSAQLLILLLLGAAPSLVDYSGLSFSELAHTRKACNQLVVYNQTVTIYGKAEECVCVYRIVDMDNFHPQLDPIFFLFSRCDAPMQQT